MSYETGRLVIERPDTGRRDLLRSYRILLDGQLRARLKRGQSVTLDLSPGPHAVQARIDWTGSPTLWVDIHQRETVSLRVQPAGGLRQPGQMFSATSYLDLSPHE